MLIFRNGADEDVVEIGEGVWVFVDDEIDQPLHSLGRWRCCLWRLQAIAQYVANHDCWRGVGASIRGGVIFGHRPVDHALEGLV